MSADVKISWMLFCMDDKLVIKDKRTHCQAQGRNVRLIECFDCRRSRHRIIPVRTREWK